MQEVREHDFAEAETRARIRGHSGNSFPLKCRLNRPAVDIEGHFGECGGRKERDFGGIIAATQLAAEDLSGEDDKKTDIARIVEDGVNADDAIQFDVEVGFLLGFSDRALLDGLVDLEKTCGKRPQTFFRGESAPYKEYFAFAHKGHGRGRNGILVPDETACRAAKPYSITEGFFCEAGTTLRTELMLHVFLRVSRGA